MLRGGVLRASGSRWTLQVGEHFVRHPRAHAAGVDELAIVGIVAEQQRSEIRPRSFRSDQPPMTNSWRFSALALRQRPRFPGA